MTKIAWNLHKNAQHRVWIVKWRKLCRVKLFLIEIRITQWKRTQSEKAGQQFRNHIVFLVSHLCDIVHLKMSRKVKEKTLSWPVRRCFFSFLLSAHRFCSAIRELCVVNYIVIVVAVVALHWYRYWCIQRNRFVWDKGIARHSCLSLHACAHVHNISRHKNSS